MYNFSSRENMTNIIVSQTSSARLKLWAVFLLYVIVAGFAIARHELRGDEIHSWNIAKASGSISDLISNARYEGHPPVWYLILWSISKFTHNLDYVQIAQFIIACAVVFMVLLYSPFPLLTRILIPFGYYFLFEYAILSRNYAIGVLPALCICYIIHKDFKYKLVLYYALLFFMSNTHLVALLLAGSLHLYYLLLKFDQNKKINKLFPHVLLGILVFLPALYFISPPSDSGLTVEILASKFDQQHLGVIAKSPLRTFIPVPAWWEHNFWNTQFLLALQGKNIVLRLLTLLLSVGVLGLVWLVLKDSKKSLTLFIINLLLTFIVAVIFPLTTQRYIGFIFIGFIAAYWLRCYERPVHRRYNWLVNILLGIQVVAGVFVVSKDIRLPFSNFDRVNELIKAVPPNEKIVTDYWCVNTISAFSDSTFYCIGLDSLPVFLQWKKENNSRGPGAYFNSVKKLFERENLKRIYLISTYPTHIIFELDPQLEKFYKLTIIEKREGAIDKWGNLYLYEISSITPSSGVLGAVRSTFAHINLAPREIFDKYKGVPRLNFL